MRSSKLIIIGAVAILTLTAISPARAAKRLTHTKKRKRTSSHLLQSAPVWRKPSVVGTVSTIDGTTISVNNEDGTDYTIDASHAAIADDFGSKAKILALVDLKTGDRVSVIGTVSNTLVVATKIIDSINFRTSEAPVAKAIFGTVQSIAAPTFTVAAHNPHQPYSPTSTYTVTTSNTTVFAQDDKDATMNNLILGQTVMITGTVDTSTLSVTADHVNIMTLRVQRPLPWYAKTRGKKIKSRYYKKVARNKNRK